MWNQLGKLKISCTRVSEARERTLHGQEQNNAHGKPERVTRQWSISSQHTCTITYTAAPRVWHFSAFHNINKCLANPLHAESELFVASFLSLVTPSLQIHVACTGLMLWCYVMQFMWFVDLSMCSRLLFSIVPRLKVEQNVPGFRHLRMWLIMVEFSHFWIVLIYFHTLVMSILIHLWCQYWYYVLHFTIAAAFSM